MVLGLALLSCSSLLQSVVAVNISLIYCGLVQHRVFPLFMSFSCDVRNRSLVVSSSCFCCRHYVTRFIDQLWEVLVFCFFEVRCDGVVAHSLCLP